MITMNVYYVDQLLNPNIDKLNIHEDTIVKSGILDTMRKSILNIDGHYIWNGTKLQTLKKHRDGFYNMPLPMEANIPSHEWCNLMGGKGTHLTPFH